MSRNARARCPATAARPCAGSGPRARTRDRPSYGKARSCGRERAARVRRGEGSRRTDPRRRTSCRLSVAKQRRVERLELVGILAGGPLRPRIDLRMALRFEEARVERTASCVVGDDPLLHVREPDALDPRRRPLEVARLLAIELQERAAVFEHLVGGRHLAQEVRRAHLHAAVAADMDLVARLDADDAEILDRRLGAVSRASGYRELHLARVPRAPRHALEPDPETRRILRAEPAPLLADARLHGAERLAVRVARDEACRGKIAPDSRQILLLHAEEVD